MSEDKKQRDPFPLVLQIFLLAVCLPFAPFVLGTLTEAVLWSKLLSRVPGITFVGGFWEAVSLSLVCSATLFVGLALFRLAKVTYLKSQGKDPEEKNNVPLEKARAELQAARRPAFRPAIVRFCVMFVTLYVLSSMVPERLNFVGPIYVAGVSFLMTVVFYLFMSIVLVGTQLFVAWFEKNSPTK